MSCWSPSVRSKGREGGCPAATASRRIATASCGRSRLPAPDSAKTSEKYRGSLSTIPIVPPAQIIDETFDRTVDLLRQRREALELIVRGWLEKGSRARRFGNWRTHSRSCWPNERTVPVTATGRNRCHRHHLGRPAPRSSRWTIIYASEPAGRCTASRRRFAFYRFMSFILVSRSSREPITKVSPATITVYRSPAKMLPEFTTSIVAMNGAKPPIQPLPNCSATETPL